MGHVGRLAVPLEAGEPEEVYREDEDRVEASDITNFHVEMLRRLAPHLTPKEARSLLLSSAEA